MNEENKYKSVKYFGYFFLLGLILLCERWTVCFGDSGGGMDFTVFLQLGIFKLLLLLFVIYDLLLHKPVVRIAAMIIQFAFILWSFAHYFRVMDWTEKLQSKDFSEQYPTLTVQSVDDFVGLWIACNAVILYLLLAVGVSHLIKKWGNDYNICNCKKQFGMNHPSNPTKRAKL